MQQPNFRRYAVPALALLALVGWSWAIKLRMAANDSPTAEAGATHTGMRKRTRPGSRQTSTSALGGLASSSRSARLFADLAEIAAAAKPGVPNESLLAACEQTMQDPDYIRRGRDFGLLLELMRPEDAVRIHLNFVAMHQEGRDFGQEYEAFATRWGEVDAPGALDYFLSENPVNLPPRDMEKIARSWGHTDPLAALRWMDEHPEIAASRGGWGSVIKGWLRIDSAAATNYLLSNDLPPDQVAETIRYALVEKLFSSGLDDATEWLVSLPDDGLSGMAAAHAWRKSVYRLSELPPDRAASVWSKVGSQPWMEFREFVRFGDMIARNPGNQPSDAEFLNALHSQWPTEQAAAQFRNWFEKDQSGVTRWLDRVPDTAFTQAMRESIEAP